MRDLLDLLGGVMLPSMLSSLPPSCRFFIVIFALVLLIPRAGSANGLVSHLHISDLAVELLPSGELRDLLEDPELLEVYRAGSIFPDTGYAADDPFGEMAHWEPFIDAYLQHIRETYGPDYESDEARRHIAFLMGVASHSLADQWFDSLFMARVDQYDGSSENLDIGSDPWLIVEQQPDARIEGWLDAATMNTVFAERLGYEPGEAAFVEGMELVVMGINGLYTFADDLYDSYWREMPWGATHYHLGAEAPGSLPHISEVVALYWQVVWLRLQGTDEAADSFLMTWPPDGYENFEVDPELIETRIAVAYGHGIHGESLNPENIRLLDADGIEVPSRSRFMYGSDMGTVVLVRPDQQLAYDTEHTLDITVEITPSGGRAFTEPVTLSFHTRCAPESLDDCPPLPDPWVVPDGPPERPEPDAGPDPEPDAGPGDADLSDGGPDGGLSVSGGGCQGCRAIEQRPGSALWRLLL